MRKNKRLIAAMVCVMVMGMTACGSGDDNAAGGSQQIDPVPIAEAQGTQPLPDGQQESQEQVPSDSDEEL